jgi:hypothetical protein
LSALCPNSRAQQFISNRIVATMMPTTLDRDEVIRALEDDMRRYPPDSEDYQELLHIKQMLLRARATGDTVHLIAITSGKQSN